MAYTRDEHEAILNDLLNPELEQSRRTELLQQLRVDYGGVLADNETNAKQIEKLTKDNGDLVIANSQLFRKVGITDIEDKKEEEKKTFSQTVKISDFEKE